MARQDNRNPKKKVGELRPSQILFTFGVGAVVDLPDLSVMVMGLDDWSTRPDFEITEPRLLQAVCRRMGETVQKLFSPPIAPDTNNPFDEDALLGVPIAPFPRWLICPWCKTLAPLQSGLFELKHEPYHPERTRYVHHNCQKPGRPPTVIPVRFLVACENGHLDDFPWVEFVHQGSSSCNAILELRELGVSGEAADLLVRCMTCQKTRRLVEAFGPAGEVNLEKCSGRCAGRHFHLRKHDEAKCECPKTAILLGASNSWFPASLSVISIPTVVNRLDQLVEQHWADLKEVESQQNVRLLRRHLPALAKFSDEDIWASVQRRRKGPEASSEEAGNVKVPEWEALSNPVPERNSGDFSLVPSPVPRKYEPYFERIVKVERLREVRALTGFTRIDSPGDNTDIETSDVKVAPLCRSKPTWVPAVEVRGEGIFIQFKDSVLSKWEKRARKRNAEFAVAYQNWRKSRALNPETGYPGIRFALLHSFSHALMRQLSLECGYAAASIRERVYSSEGGTEESMAGVLLYTAAPDSEGTLGGLVRLAEPDELERHIDQALEMAGFCSSDPLCAENRPGLDRLSLHGAACHACLLAPETSCESGNRFLDRSLLADTFECKDLAFFGHE